MRRLAIALPLLLLIAAPVAAQRVFITTVVLGMTTRQGGEYSFSAVSVPTGVRGLALTIDVSEATDPLPALSAEIECSQDGGTNWGTPLGFSRAASPKGQSPTGPVTAIGATFRGTPCWNDVNNANRRLRGSATIGGTMRFALTVQPL